MKELIVITSYVALDLNIVNVLRLDVFLSDEKFTL